MRFSLQFHKPYWRFRKWNNRIGTYVQGRVFRGKQYLTQRHERLSIAREMGKIIISQALLAVFIVIVLLMLDHLLQSNRTIHSIYTDFLLPRVPFLRKLANGIDANTYVLFLSTLLQISGVFLGLYFTAITGIINTIYARVQGDVRSVLISEKVGNQYIRVVALLGAITALLLAVKSVGYDLGVVTLIFVLALGVWALLGFVRLGIRTFNFLDPTHLVTYITPEIIQSMQAATPSNIQWNDATIQTHYQRKAELFLITYRNIVHLSRTADYAHLLGTSLMILAKHNAWLWQYYSVLKTKIPSNSRWFKRSLEYPDWFLTNYTQVGIALETSTTLLPTYVPDRMWVEGFLVDTYKQLVSQMLELEDLSFAIKILSTTNDVLDVLSTQFALEESYLLYEALTSVIKPFIQHIDLSSMPLSKQDDVLVLVRLYGYMPITMLIGMSNYISTLSDDEITRQVARIDWKNDSDIYKLQQSRSVLERLEYLQQRLDFERKIEGKYVTPQWYQAQLISGSIVSTIGEYLSEYISALEDLFLQEMHGLVSESKFLLAAPLFECGLEVCAKWKVHSQVISESMERLGKLRRIPDLQWADVDWDDFHRRIDKVHQSVVIGLARSAPALSTLPKSPGGPDFFGHAYAVLATECYMAMMEGNQQQFQELFPSFFRTSLSAYDRLASQLAEYPQQNKAIWITEPIEDLLEMSGFSLLYSELDNKGYWTLTESLWTEYFSKALDSNALTDFFFNVIAYRQSQFAILPRDLERQKWKQGFEGRIREKGLMGDDYYPSIHPSSKRKNIHSSPIIRSYVRGRYINGNASDVFVVCYLMQHAGTANRVIRGSAKSFSDSLKRERSKDSGQQEGDDE